MQNCGVNRVSLAPKSPKLHFARCTPQRAFLFAKKENSMKMKHKLKRGLAFLLAGGLVLTNLGTALPAFSEESQATPETATSDSA